MRQSYWNFFRRSFNIYSKNLHIALPMLFFLVISFILSAIFSLIFIFSFFSFFGKKILTFQNINEETLYTLMFSNPEIFFSFLFKIIILTAAFVLLEFLFFLFFYTSTLKFAKDIINGKDKKEILKKSFVYGIEFWKILAFFVVLGILSALYFIIVVPFFKLSLALGIFFLLIFSLAYPFLINFLIPMPFSLIYYNQNLFDIFKITIKNTKENYWEIFGLWFLPVICLFIISILFLFLSIMVPFFGWIFSIFLFLFFKPYLALIFMLYIKEKWKK